MSNNDKKIFPDYITDLRASEKLANNLTAFYRRMHRADIKFWVEPFRMGTERLYFAVRSNIRMTVPKEL
jgi:hypothetical protein